MPNLSISAVGGVREDFCLLDHLHPRALINALRRGEAIVWVLVISLVVRGVLAILLPLTADEAYAVVVSRSHALSYYDHPPLAFALARLMADLSGGENAAILRLPFLAMGTASTILLYDITRRSFGGRAAFWASAAFACSPFFLSSAGVLIVPDGPLDLFLLLCVWAMQPILQEGKSTWSAWLLAGTALGLAMASKYHAALFGAAAVIGLAAQPHWRPLLLQPKAWAAAGLAALGAVPIVVWNAQHDWASLAFQTARAYGDDSAAMHAKNILTVLGGQALYLLPVTWFVAQRETVRGLLSPASPMHNLLAWLAILPIVAFDMVAVLGHHSLPHWSMSGLLFALPLVGDARARFEQSQPEMPQQRLRLRLMIAAVSVGVVSLLAGLDGQTGVLTGFLGHGSGTKSASWQGMPWSAIAPELGAGTTFLVAPGWVAGGQVGLAAGPGYAIDVPSDEHHFQFMDHRPQRGDHGYVLVPLALNGASVPTDLTADYVATGRAHLVVQSRLAGPAFAIMMVPVDRR